MRRLARGLAALVMLASAGGWLIHRAAHADDPFSQFVTNAQEAAAPFVATDFLPLIRGGKIYHVTGAVLTAIAGGVTSVGFDVPASSIFAVIGSPVTTNGTLQLTTSGTSGGIPYFVDANTLNSSGLLTANAFLTGGGPGAAPHAVVISGLVKGNGSSAPGAYGGTGCSGQFVRSLDLNGVATCATVGSGDLAASLSLTTPALGTPSSGVATNLTGTAAGLTAGTVTTNANLTGPITSSGNATQIASQTGTGTKFVVDTGPVLITPNIGVATATSINGNTLTTGSGTLTLGAGKILTSSNTLTLTATDGSTLAIGGGGALGSNAYTSTAYAPLASPTFTGTVGGANVIPLSTLAQAGANTMVGNWTGSTANMVANAMISCPDTGGNHLNYVSGTGVTCGTGTAGSLSLAIVTGASPITLATTNLLTSVISMASPAASTINLPAIQAAGWRQCVKDGTTGFATNNATIKPNPTSLTIDGVAGTTGILMNINHEELCFMSDGTNWIIE